MGNSPDVTALTIRWVARSLSILSLGMMLLFIFGEGISPLELDLNEFALLLCFPLGTSAGMVIGWRREGLGGTVTVSGLALFYLIHFVGSGRFPKGPFFLIFSLPGFVFLASWLVRHVRSRR